MCRFAPPEEFLPEDDGGGGWFSFGGKKKDGDADDKKAANKVKKSEAAAKRKELRRRAKSPPKSDAVVMLTQEENAEPQGNWLWQLVREVLPEDLNDDCTDILNEEFPPAHNRRRNPKCHPCPGGSMYGADPLRDVTGPESDGVSEALVPATGPGTADAVGGAPGLLKASSSRRGALTAVDIASGAGSGAGNGGGGGSAGGTPEKVSDITIARRKAGLPDIPDPNSRSETTKRVNARRGALHMNVPLKFYVPRDELETVLVEYRGAYGKIAMFEDDVGGEGTLVCTLGSL